MWGEEYIEYFERLCLKSLLNNNINKSKKISFNIYCFKDELNQIKSLKNMPYHAPVCHCDERQHGMV